MGGKGIRRREKNYKAAHGGSTRLPPPPDPSSVDAIPSKLRKLMSFAGVAKQADNHVKGKKTECDDVNKGSVSGEASESSVTGAKRKRSDQSLTSHKEHGDNILNINIPGKKKKKRNNKKADDLRFQTVGEPSAAGSQRKERKKKRLEERKKKHKRGRMDDGIEFHNREQIKFGEVVQAPPKLTSVPKAFKTVQAASQERLRIQAVEVYRKRKGWLSRPGVQLPQPDATTSPL